MRGQNPMQRPFAFDPTMGGVENFLNTDYDFITWHFGDRP